MISFKLKKSISIISSKIANFLLKLEILIKVITLKIWQIDKKPSMLKAPQVDLL